LSKRVRIVRSDLHLRQMPPHLGETLKLWLPLVGVFIGDFLGGGFDYYLHALSLEGSLKGVPI
jgi:hypothetical protein